LLFKNLLQTGYKKIVVSGGVGANQRLREKLRFHSKNQNFKVYFPKLEFCTDNGAMIALAGALRAHLSSKNNYKFSVQPRWKLSEIESTF
jgi:N6-L-threonylcarbamoyladenine synthase